MILSLAPNYKAPKSEKCKKSYSRNVLHVEILIFLKSVNENVANTFLLALSTLEVVVGRQFQRQLKVSQTYNKVMAFGECQSFILYFLKAVERNFIFSH